MTSLQNSQYSFRPCERRTVRDLPSPNANMQTQTSDFGSSKAATGKRRMSMGPGRKRFYLVSTRHQADVRLGAQHRHTPANRRYHGGRGQRGCRHSGQGIWFLCGNTSTWLAFPSCRHRRASKAWPSSTICDACPASAHGRRRTRRSSSQVSPTCLAMHLDAPRIR